MVASRKPAVSVVIPTFNWSAALRCAIRSVLLQTMQDFEILVVGDGCTDDSEAVVASFGDPRIRWHNLDRNYGSQWKANNHANEQAAGDWIAYLGHDDIWYPTHLEAILRAAKREAADVVTSTMILYWPESTGGRSIAGVFASGAYTPYDFVPPSALAHLRALYGDALVWRDPETLALPMDAAFINAFAAEKCRFAQTHELTCFKFNAAWRRDSYKLKPVDEQQRLLARIESGVDFRNVELLDLMQAVVSGRFFPIVAPPTAGIEEGEVVRLNRRFKGAASRFNRAALQRITEPTRFDLSSQTMPFEWHRIEHDAGGSYRWSGPSTRATIDLPVLFDRDLRVRIDGVAMLRPELIGDIKLSIHGTPLSVSVGRKGAMFVLETRLRRAEIAATDRDFGITIDTGTVTRPFDVGLGYDRRWLGVAISSVELSPLSD
jgi:glycosyltransferase involved in cell wall biosynthesis